MYLGSQTAFLLGFVQAVIGITTQFFSIYILAYQSTISMSLIHFVQLEIIMEFPKFYFEAITADRLKEILHHKPKNVVKGKDVVFSERTCFH